MYIQCNELQKIRGLGTFYSICVCFDFYKDESKDEIIFFDRRNRSPKTFVFSLRLAKVGYFQDVSVRVICYVVSLCHLLKAVQSFIFPNAMSTLCVKHEFHYIFGHKSSVFRSEVMSITSTPVGSWHLFHRVRNDERRN